MKRLILPTILCTFFLFGCDKGNNPSDISQLLGSQSATGTITATGTSLFRRGTHVLSIEGQPRLYLESKHVNLAAYEGKMVVANGEIGLNSYERFLPVMQVESVRLTAGGEEESQEYDATSLGITVNAPKDWKGTLREGTLRFTLPDASSPFIRIEETTGTLPEEGIPIRIDGHNGMRVVEETSGIHLVFIEIGINKLLQITFAPPSESNLTELRNDFYAMLRDAKIADNTESDTETDSEITGSMQPCGGSAGVVCPIGEYCKILEIDTGIGKCYEVK